MKTQMIFYVLTVSPVIPVKTANVMTSNGWSGILAMIVVLILCYNLFKQMRPGNRKSRFSHTHNHR